MKGYKGFSKDFKCRDMQYEIGKNYTHDGDVELCRSGLHFVESPLDAFGYYPPNEGRYTEVEADGVSDEKHDQDSKRVAKSLHIGAELSLSALIGAGVKFVLDKVDWEHAKESNSEARSAATNTGDYSAATNTGDYSAATNTGDYSAATNTGARSAATNTGDYSAATNTGKEGWAVSLGIEGRAKGAIGCWLVLAEWSDKGGEWHPMATKVFRVDGKKVKADTFYTLKNGKLVEATC